MDRDQLERRIDELREEHPERSEFVAAVKELGDSLDDESRETLGMVLLERQPERGGFDVLNERLEEGGWLKRTMRKVEESERRPRER